VCVCVCTSCARGRRCTRVIYNTFPRSARAGHAAELGSSHASSPAGPYGELDVVGPRARVCVCVCARAPDQRRPQTIKAASIAHNDDGNGVFFYALKKIYILYNNNNYRDDNITVARAIPSDAADVRVERKRGNSVRPIGYFFIIIIIPIPYITPVTCRCRRSSRPPVAASRRVRVRIGI